MHAKKKAIKDLPHLGSRKILGLLMSSVGIWKYSYVHEQKSMHYSRIGAF
jgi:hypothetical protein